MFGRTKERYLDSYFRNAIQFPRGNLLAFVAVGLFIISYQCFKLFIGAALINPQSLFLPISQLPKLVSDLNIFGNIIIAIILAIVVFIIYRMITNINFIVVILGLYVAFQVFSLITANNNISAELVISQILPTLAFGFGLISAVLGVKLAIKAYKAFHKNWFQRAYAWWRMQPQITEKDSALGTLSDARDLGMLPDPITKIPPGRPLGLLDGYPVFAPGDATWSLLMMQTGYGKTASAVIPAILDALLRADPETKRRGSVFVIDPKGELCGVLSGITAKLGIKTLFLNPTGIDADRCPNTNVNPFESVVIGYWGDEWLAFPDTDDE